MKKLFFALMVFTLVLAPIAAMAVPVGVPTTGSRTVPATSGVTATEDWASAFTVEWDIQYGPGNAYVTYEYTFTVDRKDFSHIILEVSSDATKADFFNFSWSNIEGPKIYGPSDPSNPGIPGDVYGIKFDSLSGTTITLSFDSYRLPMWGDFYVKDGKTSGNDVYAYNTGFGTEPDVTGPFTNWIPVPDTAVVPIPGSLLLLGSGVLGLVGLRRKF